jgi:putative membrane protein
MLRISLAFLHLLALGIGLGAAWARARAFRTPPDRAAIQRAFTADAWWGAAAALWIASGLWRLLAGTEKATGYYLQNHLFLAKMGGLVLILALELYPMTVLVRWRAASARGTLQPDAVPGPARRIGVISYVECGVVVLMVLAAVMMARGYGAAG